MRNAIFISLLLLIGCASNPTTQSAASPQPPSAPVASEGTLTQERILQLQREGYKLVDRDGETYFCRVEKKTGSKIARDTVCLTEKQMESLRETTQRRLGEISRQRPPPQGK